MALIENLKTNNPFSESIKAEYIHIRIQKRTGKKFLTILQGLPQDLDSNKILIAFRKNFNCGGKLIDDPNFGQVIQLQGDHRQNITNFLINEGISTKESIKIHGF